MIKLNVYDFCHRCSEFDPIVIERQHDQILTGFDMTKREPIEKCVIKGDTIISCKDSSKCFAIASHFMKNQIKEEK